MYILNDLIPEQQSSETIALELKQAMNYLKSQFFDLETGKVKYAEIKGSEPFQHYCETAAQLKNFDLNQLQTQSEKLAFWINLYNILTVHGIITLNITQSIKEVGIQRFFSQVAYKIGDFTFSLDDIEHGILRQNRKKHLLSPRPFGRHDPRQAWMMERLEPRIHFTLVCGSQSCPPIGVYQAEKIEEQLALAASGFINSDNIFLDRQNHRLLISKIFQWYAKDFGNKAAVLRFIANYCNRLEDRAFILDNLNKLAIKYLEYHWNLNQ